MIDKLIRFDRDTNAFLGDEIELDGERYIVTEINPLGLTLKEHYGGEEGGSDG